MILTRLLYIGSFTCQCAADFDGEQCELELAACSTRLDACDENGTAMCENLDPVFAQPPFECLCNPGYSGSRCQLSDCVLADPCTSNGECFLDSLGVANCRCLTNETGQWTDPICGTWEENTNVGTLFGSVLLALIALVASGVMCIGYLNKRGQRQLVEKQLDKAQVIRSQLRKRQNNNELYDMRGSNH